MGGGPESVPENEPVRKKPEAIRESPAQHRYLICSYASIESFLFGPKFVQQQCVIHACVAFLSDFLFDPKYSSFRTEFFIFHGLINCPFLSKIGLPVSAATLKIEVCLHK